MNINKLVIIKVSIVCLITTTIFFSVNFYLNHLTKIEFKKNETIKLLTVRTSLDRSLMKNSNWPEEIEFMGRTHEIEYTFNKDLSRHVRKLLARYKSDFSAIIIINNDTGEILSAEGYQRKGRKFNAALPFSSTHPSASLFKIITTAELLQNSNIQNNSVFDYRGKPSTLYKYQLRDVQTKWTRYLTLEKAFAVSNNVIFGKAAIKHSTGFGIFKMASNFGFNSELMDEISVSKSIFHMPKNQYNLAELASGFNAETLISPVHAAVMASIIANDGILKHPIMISKVLDTKTGENIWNKKIKDSVVVDQKTSRSLGRMMVKTVRRGTARGSFRRLKRIVRNNILIGGKTGTITGGVPLGRRDWFIAYASPKDSILGNGISISVMNVNIDKWYIKSAYLARNIIEYYYSKLRSEIKNVSKTTSDKKVIKTEV